MGTEENQLLELIQGLTDHDEQVRENSAYLLGEMAVSASDLEKNTLKSSKTLNEINALTIPDVRTEVVKHLIDALLDTSSWVRGNAAEALGKCGNELAINALIMVAADKETVVRYSAVEALGKFKTTEAVDLLTKALSDEHWSIRGIAAESLGNLGALHTLDHLAVAANDSHREVRIKAQQAIEKLSSMRFAGANTQTAEAGRNISVRANPK